MRQSDGNIEGPSVTSNIMGYEVFNGKLADIKLTGERRIINTLNAFSYVVAKKDLDFSDALKYSDILLPDGMPIVLASRILNRSKTMRKIAGYDIFCHLMNKLNNTGGKCFFLGASEQTLEMIVNRSKLEYPNVVIKTFSPPFKSEFSENDNKIIINTINLFSPDVLMVGMTAPKQEKWVKDNINNLNIGTVCSIGAVFDFYAQTVQRPGRIWVKLGLEWLVRLMKEPKRLWKRYLISSPLFFLDLFLCFIRIKKFR